MTQSLPIKPDGAPEAPPLYDHQIKTVEFGKAEPIVFDTSDPGTGKTRAWLEVLRARFQSIGGKALVVAPKSILKPAWANDIERFTPELTYTIANASNRAKAMGEDVQIYITNHDAVSWFFRDKNVLKYLVDRGFHSIIVDESTAFKHRTSARSKALKKLIQLFIYRTLMTGTPTPNGVLDIWHQACLLDGGARLGDSYWRFRATVCQPIQIGPSPQHLRWDDKPGSIEAVADLLSDITIRHVFEDCIDIPPNVVRNVDFQLTPAHQKKYKQLKETALLEVETGEVEAFNAAILANKLLQLASGAVYDGDSVAHTIATERYELVAELVSQREHSLTVFNWQHQRAELEKLFDKRGITYAVIDGSVTQKRRDEAVEQFEAGRLQTLLVQPQSASHGLTLVRGTATIWASPVYNAEHFVQMNKRIYRAGQTQATETILISAKGTIDTQVYDRMLKKRADMQSLLEMLRT